MDEVRELTAQGWRLKELALRYGCSRQTVLDRMNEAGIAAHPQHSNPGARNPAWKGGRYFDNDGYVLIYAPNHPYATKNKRVREHRLVVEAQIGRFLLPGEVVDHIDGNRTNNAPENLRVFSRNSEHLAVTLKGKVPKWTPEGWARICGPKRKRQSAIPA